MIAWQSDFVGRGYLRFPEVAVVLPGPQGDIDALVVRSGPSRVEIRLSGAGERPTEALEGIARRLQGLIVVYCQAPIVNFNLACDWSIDDAGELHQNAWVRMLEVPVSEAAVVIPFEHMTDMSPDDVADLARVLEAGKAIPQRLLDAIQHTLTQAEDVEAFLANYAVLDSVLGGGKAGVDAFILQEEPGVEMLPDSRRKLVTIYTLLRNAKGHPTGMAPGEASRRIRHLLPALRRHVRTALLRQATG